MVLHKIKNKLGTDMSMRTIAFTKKTPEILPYTMLDVKLTQSAIYSDQQLVLLRNMLLEVPWPSFQEHFELGTDMITAFDGWKAMNMVKKIDFPTSFERGNILDFIKMVTSGNQEKTDGSWVRRVQERDYHINFCHAVSYLLEGLRNLSNGIECDLSDVESAKLILINIAILWDTNEECMPVAEYHFQKNKGKEKLERQSVFNIREIPDNHRNCHIYELVSLGQRLLRRFHGIIDKGKIVDYLCTVCKEFNYFNFKEDTLEIYGSSEVVLLNAIVLAGIYTLELAPERILRQDWLMKPPFVRPVAAFETCNLNPYIIAALLTKTYMEKMECKPKK